MSNGKTENNRKKAMDLLRSVRPVDADESGLIDLLDLNSAENLYRSGTQLPDKGEDSQMRPMGLLYARVAETAVLVLTGRTRSDLVTWMMREYDVSRGIANSYWKLAQEKIQKDFDDVLRSALAEQVMTRRKLRQASDDPRFILECLDSEAKLLGLSRFAAQIEITGPGGGPLKTIVSQEQIVVHQIIDGVGRVVEESMNEPASRADEVDQKV